MPLHIFYHIKLLCLTVKKKTQTDLKADGRVKGEVELNSEKKTQKRTKQRYQLTACQDRGKKYA